MPHLFEKHKPRFSTGHLRLMAPTPLLQNTMFGPDEIVVLVAAFEGALRQMDLVMGMDTVSFLARRRNET